MKKDTNQQVLIEEFDEEDWADLMKRPRTVFSWREETHLAGEEYLEDGREFLRSN